MFIAISTLITFAASAASAVSPGEDPQLLTPQSLRVAASKKVSQNLDDALYWYERAAEKATKEYGADSCYVADIYFEMGCLALDAKKFQRAQNYLEHAVERNPNSIMARVKLAELLQIREQNQAALKEIQHALQKNSKSPQARHALVMWLLAQKNPAAAVHESYIMGRVMTDQNFGGKLASATIPRSGPGPAEPPKGSGKFPTAKAATMVAIAPPPAKKSVALESPKHDHKKEQEEKQRQREREREKEKAREREKAREKERERERKREKEKAERERAKKKPPTAPVKEPLQQEPVAIRAVTEKLSTSAKVTSAKSEAKTESLTENEVKPSSKPQAHAAPPAQTPAAVQPPVEPIRMKQGKPRKGILVPPPPPTPPPWGVMPAPVIRTQKVEQPRIKEPAKKEPPPKKEPPKKESAPEVPEERHAAPPNEAEGEFLLDWGDVKAKKKRH